MTRALAHTSLVQDSQSSSVSAPDSTKTSAQDLFHRVAPKACTLAAFLLPLKLSLTYIVIVPLLLAFLWTQRAHVLQFISAPSISRVTTPLTILVAIALISAVTGLSLAHSVPSLASLIFFCATIPLYALHAQTRPVCIALIAGQSIAALHSLFEAALPGGLSRLFLGKVTESGQLALTIPLAVGLCMLMTASSHPHQRSRQRLASLLLTGLLVTTSLVLLGFNADANLSAWAVVLLACIATIVPLAATRLSAKAWDLPPSVVFLSVVQLPLLLCALVVNLKRGPWIGTLLAASAFCFLYSRKLVLGIIAGAITLACVITPVRERLLNSYEHFTISGGRSTIWRIGAELATEYPLGIGYHNSGIMRELAPEIPPELKHFHNNLINITTELGWLGGAVFIWLLLSLLKVCFKDRSAPLYTAIGCAIIAWQVAGLFEYNFGDSEITLIVWALVGLVLQREYRQPQLSDSHHDRAPA
jgi:hypothetical protein